MEYDVPGIWTRTEAVSSGYFTRVLEADKAALAKNPLIPSFAIALSLAAIISGENATADFVGVGIVEIATVATIWEADEKKPLRESEGLN